MAKFEASEYPITKTERSNERFYQMLNTNQKQDFIMLIFIDSEGEIIFSVNNSRLYPKQVINEVNNNLISGREIAGLLKYKDPRSCVLYLRTDINFENKYLPNIDKSDTTTRMLTDSNDHSEEEKFLDNISEKSCIKYEPTLYPLTKTEHSDDRFYTMLNSDAKQDFKELTFIDSEGNIIYKTAGKLSPGGILNKVKSLLVEGRNIAGLIKWQTSGSCVLYTTSNANFENNNIQSGNDEEQQEIQFRPEKYNFTKIERSMIRLKTMAASSTNQDFIELSFINSEGMIIFKTCGKTNPRKYLNIIKQKLNNNSFLSGLIKWKSNGSCVLYITDNFKSFVEQNSYKNTEFKDDDDLIENITSSDYDTIFNKEINVKTSSDEVTTIKQLPENTKSKVLNNTQDESNPNVLLYIVIFIVIIVILKALI